MKVLLRAGLISLVVFALAPDVPLVFVSGSKHHFIETAVSSVVRLEFVTPVTRYRLVATLALSIIRLTLVNAGRQSWPAG